MAEYRKSIVSILAEYGNQPDDPESRKLIEQIASALYERVEDCPEIEEWPQAVRYFYATYDLMYQVGNGGFAQAAFNVPELIPIAEQAYRFLDRPQAAKHCRDAIAHLPEELRLHLEKKLDEFPDLDQIFEHFDDSPMTALDDTTPDEFWIDFELQQLVKKHQAEFESMESPQSR